MKSSRNRFAEFRAKITRGLLDLEKLKKPGAEEAPNIGGHHRGPGGKHEFKLKKTTLLAEYRVLLKGYFGWVFSLIAIVILTSALSLVTPWV